MTSVTNQLCRKVIHCICWGWLDFNIFEEFVSLLTREISFSNCSDEPTKTDMHVLNALRNVELDKTIHPCIHQWKSALQQHTQEEIEK